MINRIHPYSRLLLLLGMGVGAMLIKSFLLLLVGYIALFIGIILIGQLRIHLRILLIALLPFLLLLLIVHGALIPITVEQTDVGIQHALRLFLRMLLLTTLFQFVFAVPADLLIPTFHAWRIQGGLLVIVVGAFTVWRDFQIRADMIITARLARGTMNGRGIVQRLWQIPFVIRPLVSGALLMAVERAASWRQLRFLEELEGTVAQAHATANYSKLYSTIVPLLVMGWWIAVYLN